MDERIQRVDTERLARVETSLTHITETINRFDTKLDSHIRDENIVLAQMSTTILKQEGQVTNLITTIKQILEEDGKKETVHDERDRTCENNINELKGKIQLANDRITKAYWFGGGMILVLKIVWDIVEPVFKTRFFG